MSKVRVEVIGLDGETWVGEATYVQVPGRDGQVGILPGHQAMLVDLTEGVARVTPDGEQPVTVPIPRGYAFVTASQVTIAPLGYCGGMALDWLSALSGRQSG